MGHRSPDILLRVYSFESASMKRFVLTAMVSKDEMTEVTV